MPAGVAMGMEESFGRCNLGYGSICGYEEGGEMAGGRAEDGELKRWPRRVGSATATAIVNSRGIP
jgi:hypothetical protein